MIVQMSIHFPTLTKHMGKFMGHMYIEYDVD